MSNSGNQTVQVEQLGEKQETALAALKDGKSFPHAAQVAGVGRATIYRWVQSDPRFRAAYNLWQQEQAESARARVLALADKAVEVVEKALDRDDQKVAVGVLRQLGAIRRPDRGATDPEVLKLQMHLAREREKYLACEGMVKHLLGKAGLSPAQQREYIRKHGASSVPDQRNLLKERTEIDLSDLDRVIKEAAWQQEEDETDGETGDETSQGASHDPDATANAQVP